MYWFIFIIIFIPMFILLPTKVYGKKNIKKGQKYIIVFNHQSNFDGIILNMRLVKQIHYVSKKELWKGKNKSFLFDNILKCIKVDREKGFSLSNMKDVYKYLGKNDCIGIAPEGTRSKEGLKDDSKIKNGACLLSIKTKTPILPCYFDKKPKLFKKTTLVVGEPFELNEFYNKKLDKENLNNAGNILLGKLNDLKRNLEKHNQEKQILKQLKNN